MRFHVSILTQARRDIDRNADWWAEHHSVDQALRWSDAVYDQLENLADFPERSGLSAENDDFPYEIRDKLVGLGSRPGYRVSTPCAAIPSRLPAGNSRDTGRVSRRKTSEAVLAASTLRDPPLGRRPGVSPPRYDIPAIARAFWSHEKTNTKARGDFPPPGTGTTANLSQAAKQAAERSPLDRS
jgi:hypothetical protein